MSMSKHRLEEIERHLGENYADILRLDIIADVRALVSEVRALSATAWRDGPPPDDAGWVWREGHHVPVLVHHFKATAFRGYGLCWRSAGAAEPDEFESWGTARWAPIPKPDNNPST